MAPPNLSDGWVTQGLDVCAISCDSEIGVHPEVCDNIHLICFYEPGIRGWSVDKSIQLSSFLLSAIRVVSFPYLRLLLFLPAILFPACASSSPAVHMMYPVYELNNQGDSIQP